MAAQTMRRDSRHVAARGGPKHGVGPVWARVMAPPPAHLCSPPEQVVQEYTEIQTLQCPSPDRNPSHQWPACIPVLSRLPCTAETRSRAQARKPSSGSRADRCAPPTHPLHCRRAGEYTTVSCTAIHSASHRCPARVASSVQPRMGDDFYLRYYVGHKGKFGHEFLEFEVQPDGKVSRGNHAFKRQECCIPQILGLAA